MKNKTIYNFLNFKKKVIIITGNEGKIGKKIENFFLSLGSKVYGIDLKKNIKSKNTYVGNVSDEKFIKSVLANVIKKEKKIDIIINNAGISFFTPFYERTNNEIIATVNSNISGIINIINNYYKIHKQKKLKKCKIINISSIYGVVSPDLGIYKKNDNINSEIYGASKAGVIQLTKYYACALAKYNIIINSISPGGISDKNHKTYFKKNYEKKVPMNRFGNEEEIFGALIYFSSDNSSYTTGQNLVIDGGLTLW